MGRRKVDSYTLKFTPVSAGEGAWAKKTENFTQIRNANVPQGRMRWAIYTKFPGFVSSFMLGSR